MNNKIVDEVREAREKYAAEFNFDLSAICKDLEKKQSLKRGRIQFLKFKKPIVDVLRQ